MKKITRKAEQAVANTPSDLRVGEIYQLVVRYPKGINRTVIVQLDEEHAHRGEWTVDVVHDSKRPGERYWAEMKTSIITDKVHTNFRLDENLCLSRSEQATIEVMRLS